MSIYHTSHFMHSPCDECYASVVLFQICVGFLCPWVLEDIYSNDFKTIFYFSTTAHYLFFCNMPKLRKIPYEAVSDYITPHMTFQLLWTVARTADFRKVQNISLFGPTATSNRLSVTRPLRLKILKRLRTFHPGVFSDIFLRL